MPCNHTTPAGIASDIHNKYADERDRLTWIFYYKLTSSESLRDYHLVLHRQPEYIIFDGFFLKSLYSIYHYLS